MSYDLQLITAAAISFALGYLSQWAEIKLARRIYKNRRRKLAKMKYA
jgi:hypothetical protein